jgi:hypothetical protein
VDLESVESAECTKPFATGQEFARERIEARDIVTERRQIIGASLQKSLESLVDV